MSKAFWQCWMVAGMLGLGVSCGDNQNYIPDAYRSTTSKLTDARSLMNQARYSEAIALLLEAHTEDPSNPEANLLLGIAYASSMGISVLDLFSNLLSGESQEGLDGLLPIDYTREDITTLSLGLDYIEGLDFSTLSSEQLYSAQFQETLYNSFIALMTLNLYVEINEDGEIDLETLSQLSADDALLIIGSLTSAAAADPDSPMAPFAENADTVLAEIETQPGATTEEKIQNYLQTQEGDPSSE